MTVESAKVLPTGWIRSAFALSLLVTLIAVLLFLFVNLLLLPFILRWDAANPVAALVIYVFLFLLTVLPFVTTRYLGKILYGKRPKLPTSKVFFILSAFFLIPALVLISMAHDEPMASVGSVAFIIFYISGLMCVGLALVLGFLALRTRR